MKRLYRLLSLVFCVALIFSASAITVSANSAQMYFSGISANGVIMPDGESPIVVENELLTFDIQEFPSNYYSDENEFLEYGGSVSAKYTFYNPSEYTVTSRLLFPFGNLPSYSGGEFDDDGVFVSFDDTSKYSITVDEQAVQTKIRHTLSSFNYEFNLYEDLTYFSDDYIADDFYSPDLTVTKYDFKVSGVDLNKYDAASIGLDVAKGINDYRIYFPKQNGSHSQKSGKQRISAFIQGNNWEFELFVFGTPFATTPEWKIYKDGGVDNKEEITGLVTLVGTSTTTFKNFALSKRSATSPVLEHDFYNALVAELNDSLKYIDFPVVSCYLFEQGFANSLMRWYEYEITLEPNARVVNTVNAPIYPDIDTDYTPSIYDYTYLLSPAKTWGQFGELKIVINTPYYMIDCNFDNFTKTSSGYALTLNGLPDEELNFSLSESQTPNERNNYFGYEPPVSDYNLLNIALISGGVLLGISLLGGAVVGIVILCKKNKKTK